MMRLTFGAIGLGLLLMGAFVGAQAPPAAGGQAGARQGGGPPPPPPTNLQVLPKDWSREQVLVVMRQFNAALGVTCAHCHVFNGAGDPMNDFATDMKPQKNMARAMMRMTTGLQPMVQQAVSKTGRNRHAGLVRDVSPGGGDAGGASPACAGCCAWSGPGRRASGWSGAGELGSIKSEFRIQNSETALRAEGSPEPSAHFLAGL